MSSAGRRRVAMVAAGASVAFAVGLALLWRAPYAQLDGLSVRALFGELGRAMLANDRDLQAAVIDRIGGVDVRQRLGRARRFVDDADVDVRRGAVAVFGSILFWEARAAGIRGAEYRRLLSVVPPLLVDGDEWVRQAATWQWISAWRHVREQVPLPGEVLDLVRNQLRSDDEQARVRALIHAGLLGVDAAPLLDGVLGAAPVGSDEHFRAWALGAIGIRDESVVGVLRGLLRDEDADVRRSAASACGDLGVFAPALLHMVEDSEEAAAVRRAAILALGLVDLTPTDVTRALRAALAAPTLNEEDHDGEWALGVGRLAARTQDEDLRAVARRVLVEMLTADHARRALAVRASLLRIAIADADDDEAARHVAELEKDLQLQFEGASEHDEEWFPFPFVDVEVEALLDALAARGPGVVDADLLRAVLEQHVAHGYDYQRAWAREQLARLPG